ncbi:unnamed protein product [Caenorhabditis angaria]|uniref:SXP/RAL-2 family protein Ani s 5-like cation-binding domain-containing protein n=1 Tax=Caenorhabditis angaria TaxID=860376 RepID=A0A9P1IZ37_9PELO|nr:unnamed protein product [Caenorhabditis angaria]
MLRLFFNILLLATVSFAALNEDNVRTPRIFRERIRDDDLFRSKEHAPVATESENDNSQRIRDLIINQAAQAEAFKLWAAQFQVFKNNMLKFVEQASEALQKHDQDITIIERVVKKLAKDLNESR